MNLQSQMDLQEIVHHKASQEHSRSCSLGQEQDSAKEEVEEEKEQEWTHHQGVGDI